MTQESELEKWAKTTDSPTVAVQGFMKAIEVLKELSSMNFSTINKMEYHAGIHWVQDIGCNKEVRRIFNISNER